MQDRLKPARPGIAPEPSRTTKQCPIQHDTNSDLARPTRTPQARPGISDRFGPRKARSGTGTVSDPVTPILAPELSRIPRSTRVKSATLGPVFHARSFLTDVVHNWPLSFNLAVNFQVRPSYTVLFLFEYGFNRGWML